MTSERVQRRIEALLDEADQAILAEDWATVAARARAALVADPSHGDARAYLEMAERGLTAAANEGAPAPERGPPPPSPTPDTPTAFVGGRYRVVRFLGEGGKKRVFLAHDELLDRDVAFALIKTEGLDAEGRERIVREAQAMGRLGAHPHVVSIFDLGEHPTADGAQPYVVTELMGGGDVEALLEGAEGGLPLEQSLRIGAEVADGLVFAHAHGVVHRDLKPGNVWLTADGRAKIGDFGLAVTTGRSRLTGHGMMVGTYLYMPPEQALGGEVTAQADLYSLGAMLYELVTGRPPFQADAPTAVITQHLHSPPVAPSWYSERCPPDLEDLILRLLEKDPARRPASASEVAEVLRRVDPDGVSASHSRSDVNPLDRLARGVFVGREAELERLRAAVDAAVSGRGGVVMLEGEPGIGKTRTAQELETYARLRGAQVQWGRAQEAAGAPPYWPWVQCGRAYRAVTPDDTRREEVRPYAGELQRLFPTIRELFPDLPEPGPAESEEARFRLFDAMSGFLHDVARRQPLVIIHDDLHWADSATLQLFIHVARELAHARVLLVGTYRDTDLDRTHPLSAALAELNREQLFERLHLRGLERAEVAAYVRDSARVEPHPQLLERLVEETEGNPFFLAEIVSLLAEEGTLVTSSEAADLAIPEGVKEALGRRLDRLSGEANALLALAAVVGREFDHALLAALTAHDEATLLDLLDEALRARVVEEGATPGAYRFTHALMQETLLGELSAARRVRLHGQIAEALEALAGTDERISELAAHYVESAVLNRDHARKAAEYARRAAEQAQAQFAWEEAIHHYERCLELVTAHEDRLGQDEAALWLELGMSRLADGRLDPTAYEHAFALWPADDPSGVAHGLLRIFAFFPIPPTVRSLMTTLDATVQALGPAPRPETCLLLAWKGMALRGPEGDLAAEQADQMARALGLEGDRYPFVLRVRPARVALDEGRLADAFAGFEKIESAFPETMGVLVPTMGLVALIAGQLDRTREIMLQAAEHHRDYRRIYAERVARTYLAVIEWNRGNGDGAEAIIQDLPSHSSNQVDMLRMERAIVTGDIEGALAEVPSYSGPLAPWRPYELGARCRVLALSGKDDAARAAFREWADIFSGLYHEDLYEFWVPLQGLDDVLCMFADDALLERVRRRLGETPEMHFWLIGSGPDYLRGAIELRLGDIEAAERWFATGLEWATGEGVPLVAGRCHQGLAEVAEQRGDTAAAREHLDAAGELFARIDARLYLEQVIAKKEILRA